MKLPIEFIPHPGEPVKPLLEALCQKWIEEERKWRESANANRTSESFARRLAYADTLSTCRRELQEAARLVVMPES